MEDHIIRFPNVLYGSLNGITHDDLSGIFTNNNTPKTVSISYSAEFNYVTNQQGIRSGRIYTSATGSYKLGYSSINASLTHASTAINGSVVIFLPANGTFSISIFHSAGSQIPVSAYRVTILITSY